MSEPENPIPEVARLVPPRDEHGRIIRTGVFRWWHDYSATEDQIAAAEAEFLRWANERRTRQG